MFLEVLTRTMGNRPQMLERNRASLAAQSDTDYGQRLLVDEERRGVAWAVRQLAFVEPAGAWVWVLDDDDECAHAGLVAGLKRIAADLNPGVVFVRMDHGAPLGVLPDAEHWHAAPVEGKIGTSAFLVRADIWNAFREHWGERYAGDFDFIAAVYEAGVLSFWWDVVASRTQCGRLMGAGE